jgi:hypothetical protein
MRQWLAIFSVCIGSLGAVSTASAGDTCECDCECEECPPKEFNGCTPGYWKQPQHFDSWVSTGFSPNQTLESVFDVPNSLGLDNVTLVEALALPGGPGVSGAARILLRAGVAALLNAASSGVDYPLSTAQVIAEVNAALASNDRSTILSPATELDDLNNQGECPLN